MSRRVLMGLAVILLAAGCSPGPSSGASVIPSPSEVAVPGEEFFLPSGCSEIDLLDPSGERVDLTGRWIGAPEIGAMPSPPGPTDWNGDWIRQTGDCLWGVGFSDIVEEPSLQPDLTAWSARLTPAFEFVATQIRVTEDDPTQGVGITFGKVAFDDSGLTVICLAQRAVALRNCPNGVGEFGVSYRVSDLPPAPSP